MSNTPFPKWIANISFLTSVFFVNHQERSSSILVYPLFTAYWYWGHLEYLRCRICNSSPNFNALQCHTFMSFLLDRSYLSIYIFHVVFLPSTIYWTIFYINTNHFKTEKVRYFGVSIFPHYGITFLWKNKPIQYYVTSWSKATMN